jgi:hypothetical protein
MTVRVTMRMAVVMPVGMGGYHVRMLYCNIGEVYRADHRQWSDSNIRIPAQRALKANEKGGSNAAAFYH